MKPTVSPPKKSNHLFLFTLLAYGISWSIGISLALAYQGVIPEFLPGWSHYLVAYGPMLAAMIVTSLSQGWPGLKELMRHMFMWRVCPKWWLVAFSPLLIGVVIIFILNRITENPIGLVELGAVNYLNPLGAGALILWILTFGLGEETGWRGFALPRLQTNHSALVATILLSIIWAIWHAPQFFYHFEPANAIGWTIGLFAGAVILTWIYNSTSGSVLIAAIWHGCFNFMTASSADTGFLPAILSTVVILWAIYVIIRHKPKYLTSL